MRGQLALRCGGALFGCLALRCGGAMCRVAMFGGFSMLGGSCSGRRRTLCRDIALCRGACFALCCGTGGLTLRGSAAIGQVTALEARHGRQQI